MKAISSVLALVVCIASTVAQDTIALKAEWTTVSPDDEPFSVQLPSKPEVAVEEWERPFRRYSSKLGSTFIYVFSERSNIKVSQYSVPLKFARSFVSTSIKRNDGINSIELFEFVDDESFYHRMILCETMTRRLIFHTMSRTKENETVRRFFENLLILNKPLNVSLPIEKSVNDQPKVEQPPKAVDSERSQSSSGLKPKAGSGSSDGRIPTTAANNAQTTPLKLLSKPKAEYTEVARFYEIAGIVRLRIVLLSNGTVGTISPTLTLPLGLTKNAIEAAKQIKFEPKTINGTPQSVIVTIDYGFEVF